jgi:hypothetical protein
LLLDIFGQNIDWDQTDSSKELSFHPQVTLPVIEATTPDLEQTSIRQIRASWHICQNRAQKYYIRKRVIMTMIHQVTSKRQGVPEVFPVQKIFITIRPFERPLSASPIPAVSAIKYPDSIIRPF